MFAYSIQHIINTETEKNRMKKIKALLSLILVLSVIVASSSMLVSHAKDESVAFAVATDIHAEGIGDDLSRDYPENELYFHARNSGNLYAEAVGILKSFLARAAKKNLDFVLIPGDIANNGREEQHKLLASILADFEDSTGIRVYVTPGNHDYFNSTPDDFKKYYSRFGHRYKNRFLYSRPPGKLQTFLNRLTDTGTGRRRPG